MCVYGYVIMHKHVHLLVNEPERPTLSDAIHYLKLSFAKRVRSRKGTIESRSFWQKRYYDRNVRDEREFSMKLRYLHRNPVKRGLVTEPAEWKWSSFRHYALREVGIVEIESEWTARDRETQAHAGPARVFLNPPIYTRKLSKISRRAMHANSIENRINPHLSGAHTMNLQPR